MHKLEPNRYAQFATMKHRSLGSKIWGRAVMPHTTGAQSIDLSRLCLGREENTRNIVFLFCLLSSAAHGFSHSQGST